LKLSKLFVAELAAIVIVVVVVVVFVEVNPALAAGNQTAPIGAFNQKLYSQNSVRISRGEEFTTSFDYSSYEPAILVVDVTFSDAQTQGALDVTCNGRYIGSVYGQSNNARASVCAISFSGTDWVKPPSAYSNAYTNQIIFSSDYNRGFEGVFNYQVSLKGSR
jgi:hypothetical protein